MALLSEAHAPTKRGLLLLWAVLAAAAPWTGAHAAGTGYARGVGPLSGCQVSATNGTATGPTSTAGAFAFAPAADAMQATLLVSSSCTDTFTGLPRPYQLQALLPAVDPGSMSVATLALAAWQTLYDPNATVNAVYVESHLRQLYSSFGVDMNNYSATSFQAEAQLTSAYPQQRALALAMLSAEAQLSALLTVGAAFVAAAAAPAGGVSAAAAALGAEVMAMSLLPAYNLSIGLVRQDLLSGSTSVVTALFTAAMADLGFVPPATYPALTSAVAVVTGICQFIAPYKAAAVLSVARVTSTNVNLLELVVILAKLEAVQAQAAVAAASLITGYIGSSDPTLTYNYAALGQRVNEASLASSVIFTSLGLPLISASVSTYGWASVTGPLTGCATNSLDEWSSYEADGGATAYGRFYLPKRGISMVSVYPPTSGQSGTCTDVLTTLPLGLILRNLAPPLSNMTVSPITLLVAGMYNITANASIVEPTVALQAQAYAAMGIDYVQYMAAFAATNPWNLSSPVLFTSPWLIAGAAANTQVVGVLFVSDALFGHSAQALFGISADAAANLVFILTAQGIAQEALTTATVNLADQATLLRILTYVHASVNYSSSPTTGRRRLSNDMPGPDHITAQEQPHSVPANLSQDIDDHLDSDCLEPGLASHHLTDRRVAAHLTSVDNRLAKARSSSEDGPAGDCVRRRGRALTIYDDYSAFTSVQTIVAGLQANINLMLQQYQTSAIAAAKTSSVTFNARGTLLNITQLSYVSQQSMFTALTTILNNDLYTGTTLDSALFTIHNTFSGSGLMAQMSAAPVNTYQVCMLTGSVCSPQPPPPAPPPAAAAKSGMSSGLIIGIGAAAGVLGVLALSLLTWWLCSCCRKKNKEKVCLMTYKSNVAAAKMTASANPSVSNPQSPNLQSLTPQPSNAPMLSPRSNPYEAFALQANRLGSKANMNASMSGNRRDIGYTSAHPLPALSMGSVTSLHNFAYGNPVQGSYTAGTQGSYDAMQRRHSLPPGMQPTRSGPSGVSRVGDQSLDGSSPKMYTNSAFAAQSVMNGFNDYGGDAGASLTANGMPLGGVRRAASFMPASPAASGGLNGNYPDQLAASPRGLRPERSLLANNGQSSLRAPPQAMNVSMRARPDGLNAALRAPSFTGAALPTLRGVASRSASTLNVGLRSPPSMSHSRLQVASPSALSRGGSSAAEQAMQHPA